MAVSRRNFILASAGGIAAPRLAYGQARSVLKFNPGNDISVLDPVWSSAFATRYLAMLSYDTLYGLDNQLNPLPQMVAGHVVENEGKLWRLTLRDGLKFHDGEPVLARDVVASLRRWGARDAFGTMLMAVTDELSAPSDKEVVFRLKTPFPLLPTALAKSTAYVPIIMPARLIENPNKQVTEVVGSGPYKYIPEERMAGVRTVWEKFKDYVPRSGSSTEYTAGPKIAHLNRIEWTVIPDQPTAVAALANGEIDWQAEIMIDLVPVARRASGVTVAFINTSGNMGIMRPNHLHPPFDNPAIRRAVLSAVSQTEMGEAVAGSDRTMWDAPVGIFCPESPMASSVGLDARKQAVDFSKVKRDLERAGYGGERIVWASAADTFAMAQQDNVGADLLRRAGMNVDLISMDFGTWLTRTANPAPPDKGGWNIACTYLPGIELWDPATHLALRGNGKAAWKGWPTSQPLEDLHQQWFSAPDETARAAICQKMQAQAWQDVPYIPTCRWKAVSAYRSNLKGILKGMPLFYNVTKN